MWHLRRAAASPRAGAVLILLSALVATGCGTGASSPAATPPSPTTPVTPSAANRPSPTPVRTPASTASGGPVIHVNLAVPLATRASMGSDCGAADLSGTGPKVSTIPGAPFELFDFEQFRELADGEPATRLERASVGKQTVPDSGLVSEPISDDPDFPAACVFSFDVATSADVGLAYLFSIGPLLADDGIYFPVPALMRADVEAAGWVANIGVNPQ
jgi:hypothetical protein